MSGKRIGENHPKALSESPLLFTVTIRYKRLLKHKYSCLTKNNKLNTNKKRKLIYICYLLLNNFSSL